MNTRIDDEAGYALDVVTHAQKVFGGHGRAADPPMFVREPDVDDRGRGYFSR